MARNGVRLALFTATIGAAILAGTFPARAHVYFTDGNAPLGVDSKDNKRHVYVSQGSSIDITVANSDGQTCSADITATGGSGVTITTKGPTGPVPTRVFTIRADVRGRSEIDIAVKGVDPCTEDSHNPVVIHVLPNQSLFLKDVGSAAKSELKLNAGMLKAEQNDLRMTVSGALSQFTSGSLSPSMTATTIANAWYTAYADAYDATVQTATNLTNYGTGQLFAGGWEECTGPTGFADGGRGLYDSFTGSLYGQLEGHRLKLDKQIGADFGNYTKIALSYDLGVTGTFKLLQYPPIEVPAPTVSPKPAVVKPLHLGYVGSVSYSTPHEQSTCVVMGGFSHPGFGDLKLDLVDGEGGTWTRNVTPSGDGMWTTMWENLKAGKTYRASAQYLNGQGGYGSANIYAPTSRNAF